MWISTPFPLLFTVRKSCILCLISPVLQAKIDFSKISTCPTITTTDLIYTYLYLFLFYIKR